MALADVGGPSRQERFVIGGSTKVCYVVADPVRQLRTPHALNQVWEREQLDIVAVPAHVGASGLADFVAGMRSNASVLGAAISVPHKQSIVDLCDELGPNARVVGAVNAIRRTSDGRLIGETFDGLGFIAGLRAEGIEPTEFDTVVLGAGGAASALAFALLSEGVASLDVSNRTVERAERLVERLRLNFPEADIGVGLARVARADLIVNATASGMGSADESPLLGPLIPAGAVAAEVVMSDDLTPFLRAAAERGSRTHEGTHMLAGQTRLIAQFVAAA